jgi:hypothetical protein
MPKGMKLILLINSDTISFALVYVLQILKWSLDLTQSVPHSAQSHLTVGKENESCKFVLPAVLFGCGTWSLTLRDEHRLRVIENRFMRISGPIREAGGGRLEKTA